MTTIIYNTPSPADSFTSNELRQLTKIYGEQMFNVGPQIVNSIPENHLIVTSQPIELFVEEMAEEDLVNYLDALKQLEATA